MLNVDESTIDFPQNYKIYRTVYDETMGAFLAEGVWKALPK